MADEQEKDGTDPEADVIRTLLLSNVGMTGDATELRRTFGISPLAHATDEDLRRAAELVSRIATAMVCDDLDAWKSISRAWEHLDRVDKTPAKWVAIVNLVEWHATFSAPTRFVRRGLQIHEPALEQLDDQTIVTVLADVRTKKIGPRLATARFLSAVQVRDKDGKVLSEEELHDKVHTAIKDTRNRK